MATAKPLDPMTTLTDAFQERHGRPPQHHDEMVLPPGTFKVGAGEDAANLPGCVLRFIVNDGAPDTPAGTCANTGELTSWRIVRSPSISVFPINIWACRLDDVRACLERLNDGVPARNPDLPTPSPEADTVPAVNDPAAPPLGTVATPATPEPEAGGTAHGVDVREGGGTSEESDAERNPS